MIVELLLLICRMLRNRNILCVATPDWEANYASTIVELMKLMAEQNNVLYVGNPLTLKDVIVDLFTKRSLPYKRIFGFSPRTRTLQTDRNTRLKVMTPPMVLTINFLPRTLYRFFLRINGWIFRRALKKELRKHNMEDQLVQIVSFNPAMGLVTGRKLGEDILIYHCYDEISAAAWMHKHGDWLERAFAPMADATIVTSQGLLERKQYLGVPLFLVKNGVNFQLFNQAFTEQTATKNRIGYTGSIDDRLDYDLLEYIIANGTELEFVFIGRVVEEEAKKKLGQYPNVKFIPPMEHTRLPSELRNFAVGIIPFEKNEFTLGIYPLKINEYLAAGMPVVTTRFGYLDEFSDIASIADSKEEFLHQLREVIRLDNEEKRRKRNEFAAQNAWESRVKEIYEIISELENDKKFPSKKESQTSNI